MKQGDLVKWIGFPGATTYNVKYGIVLKKYHNYGSSGPRVDVLWWDRSIGKRLYVDTIEVIDEAG